MSFEELREYEVGGVFARYEIFGGELDDDTIKDSIGKNVEVILLMDWMFVIWDVNQR